MLVTEHSKVYFGNSLDVLPTLDDNSLDSIVTDPPYELGFMSKSWDSSGIAYNVELWKECLRVLKPGGHLLAFSGSRTYHRMTVAIEDAGFEVRDMIAWISNKTFPKSHNLKDEWQGWGTGLKPTVEPIVMARKPLIGTVAANVLQHGTGGLNIDGSRIGTEERTNQPAGSLGNGKTLAGGQAQEDRAVTKASGRWPSNAIISESVAEQLGEDARFFYVARASKADRSEGLERLDVKQINTRLGDNNALMNPVATQPRQNFHPTVKPTALMRYLVNLVTPPNGTVLDPFTGSGSTGKAAILAGFNFVGIELTEEYYAIIEGRLKHAEAKLVESKEKEGEALF